MAQKSPKSLKLANYVSTRIKELRTIQGITQEVFYFDTGIHVGRIESSTNHIQIDTLYIICQYLGVSLKDFFSDFN